MKTIVFSDRDGTINKDENYYLGSSLLWKSQVQILEGVIEGIKLINSIPYSHFYILTNQSGVALQGKEFDNLTEKRMHEVNKYIIDQLRKNGCRISGYYACPYVTSEYAKQALQKGRLVNPKYIDDNNPDIKPKPGMIKKVLNKLNLKEEYNLWMIGDRFSDMETILNAKGEGILIKSQKTIELGDLERCSGIKNIHPADNFLDAARNIKKYKCQ
jgi:histidinol-phosphate phosphatase family protein